MCLFRFVHNQVRWRFVMELEDESDVEPVYEDLSQQHVAHDMPAVEQHKQFENAHDTWEVKGNKEMFVEDAAIMTASLHDPSRVNGERCYDQGGHQNSGQREEHYPDYEVSEAIIESEDLLTDNGKVISTAITSAHDGDGDNMRPLADTNGAPKKKSGKVECGYMRGNGICPPLPAVPASNEGWTDPPDIEAYFPKTAYYKAPAGIRFSAQYLFIAKWEKEKKNYTTKLNYWTGVLKSGKVMDCKDKERIEQLLQQLRWLRQNVWNGDMCSAIPPEMLWRARKEEMRRLEQLLSRKPSLIESMSRDAPSEPAGGHLNSQSQNQAAVMGMTKVDVAGDLAERNRALFLVLLVARRWSEALPKISEGPSAHTLLDAVEGYCEELHSFCETLACPETPLDLHRCQVLFARGGMLKERMAGCGLGHICESWDLVSDILKSRATLTSNNVSSTSPVAHSPTASANSTSDECTSLLHKNCAPSYSDRGKRENCSFDTVISSHSSNESISASEDRFELKDVDAIERRWLKFFLSLSEWKSDEISLLIQELRQLCKNYRTLLKTALPKTLADARHSACKEKIRRCEKKLEKYASEVHLKDNLKKPIPKANQNGLARSSNGGEESTKKEMKRMVGEPPSRKRSRKNASSGSPSTAVTEYVAMPKERPRRHIQLPARYRFGDEIVEEEWLVRKQNSSPSALLNIQFKETEHSQPKIEPSGTLPTVNKLPKPSTSAIDATSDRMEKIVVIRENEHGVEEELNGHASSDGDSVKIFADDRIINIEPTRERKRDGMGIVRKVTSYVVHLKNGTSQRVSKRVYQMWRRHSKEEMNVPKSPNTETNSSAIAETWQKRGQVESRPGISDDLMKGRHREEMQTSNEAHVASHGKRRSPVTPKLKVEQKKTAEVVGTCTGRHIPVGMPERGGKEDKLPEIMNCLVEKGRSDKHRATSHVEEEQQRVTSPVPNAEQEMEGDHKNVAKVDPNLQEENSSSPQDQAHIVDHSCHQMAPRTQSTVSSDEGEDNVKLKTQNEHLLLISENGFVESLRSRWMNVPLNGRYDDHVMHIKTLIVALQKCLDDRSATWADYFGQKQIVQSTIDSLLTAFSTDRLASTPCAQATALSSNTFFTQPTVLSVQSTTRCGDFRSIRSEVGNVSGRSSVASSRCLGARPVSLASADFGSSSPALNGDLQMAVFESDFGMQWCNTPTRYPSGLVHGTEMLDRGTREAFGLPRPRSV